LRKKGRTKKKKRKQLQEIFNGSLVFLENNKKPIVGMIF
jgi:hypothetical protein